MADTGEKIYLASEETAQEISSCIDSLATTNSVNNITNIINEGIDVTITGRTFTSCKTGSIAGTQNTSSETGQTVTINGAGMLFLVPSSYSDNSTHTLIIDGNTVGFSNDIRPVVFQFKESLSMSSFESWSSAQYTVMLY